MSNWAASKFTPGKFLGSTGANILSAKQLQAGGTQAWARKVCVSSESHRCLFNLAGGWWSSSLSNVSSRLGSPIYLFHSAILNTSIHLPLVTAFSYLEASARDTRRGLQIIPILSKPTTHELIYLNYCGSQINGIHPGVYGKFSAPAWTATDTDHRD